MIRPIFALFTRAVREDSRAKATYIARGVLAGLILMFLFFAAETSKWMGAPGLTFFMSVVHINFFFVTLAGIGHFSSAITEEKEEMTLGLLRMTSLNPLSILLGKSTSRLFSAVLLLLAQFPFTLLAVTLGGVSVGQVFAAYCTLAAYVLFLSNLALFFSVLCKRTGAAAFFTGLFLFLFFIVPSWGAGLLSLATRFKLVRGNSATVVFWQRVFGWFNDASPFTRLQQILSTGFSEGPVGFQVLADVALGAGFFLLAWLCFDFFTRSEGEAAPRRGFLFRRVSPLRLIGPGRAWEMPLLWKDFNFMSGGKTGMIGRFVAFGLLAGYLAYYSFKPHRSFGAAFRHEIGYPTMGFMYFFFMLEMAIAGSRIFRQEIKWKTLSSLGMLPMSVAQLAWQKAGATCIALIPSLVYFALGLLLCADELFASKFASKISDIEFGALSVVACESIFFQLLVVFMSLLVKRGALPLAIAISYLGNTMFGMLAVFMIRNGTGIMIVADVSLLIASGVLFFQIGPFLQRAIAAD